jgi:hypothetical protein
MKEKHKRRTESRNIVRWLGFIEETGGKEKIFDSLDGKPSCTELYEIGGSASSFGPWKLQNDTRKSLCCKVA